MEFIAATRAVPRWLPLILFLPPSFGVPQPLPQSPTPTASTTRPCKLVVVVVSSCGRDHEIEDEHGKLTLLGGGGGEEAVVEPATAVSSLVTTTLASEVASGTGMDGGEEAGVEEEEGGEEATDPVSVLVSGAVVEIVVGLGVAEGGGGRGAVAMVAAVAAVAATLGDSDGV